MSIVFENPLDNPLSPHHYIEFSTRQSSSALQMQSQNLLIIDVVKTFPDTMPKNTVPTLSDVKEKKYELEIFKYKRCICCHHIVSRISGIKY